MLRSTQARVVALLAGVLVVFVVALVSLQRVQSRQVERLFQERSLELEGVFERVLRMNQRAVEGLAADYSRWDDMVTFVRRRDRTWAEENIPPSFPVYGYDAAWVLDAQLAPVYAARLGGGAVPAEPPVDLARLGRLLSAHPFRHTHVRFDGGVLELWTAPIQPTVDVARATPPAGFLVLGRFWDADVLGELARMVGGRAALIPAGEPLSRPRRDPVNGVLELDVPFVDLADIPVATLRVTLTQSAYAEIERGARRTSVVVALLAVLSALLVLGAIVYWVVVPLRRVRTAMRLEDPARLGSMVQRGDEFGRLAGLVIEFFSQREALVSEVRERRRAESEAELQREFVRQVLDTDPDPVYVVDGSDRIVLANRGAHDVFGVFPGSLPGRHVDEVLEPLGLRASFHDSCALAIEAWAPATADEWLTPPDGASRRFESVRFPLRRHDGEVLVLTLSTDVTERMRERHELLAAKETAEAAMQARAQFLANISHELRTPMHGILSYARFGLREWGTAEREELREFFQNISESGESLLALLNDLLDLAKLESGRTVFRFEPVDPAELVDATLVEFEPLAHERGLVLESRALSEGEAPEMHADRAKLQQVLRNLISNAARFSPEGGTITVVTEWSARVVRVSVRDQGPGVPEADREAIFDKFVQSGMGKSATGGTGLGLAICREILDAHGGRIWEENLPEGGASFRFELPRASAAMQDGPAGADASGPVDERAA